MYEQTVFSARFKRYLPRRLNERLGFDVSDSAPDLSDDYIGIRPSAYAVYKFLYLIGYVRDHLYGRAKILAPALLVEHVPVDLAGGKVRIFVEILVDEAFIMSEIQIRLRAILGHIDLSVLERAHRSRIHVDIWVHFLSSDFKAARLQQPSERSRSDALSESRDYASCNKDVLFVHVCHLTYFPLSP